MSAPTHAAATQHLPPFITGPGETDVLMVVMAVVLLLAVVGFGILFLKLHTLPERIAHKSHKFQFEVVAVLGLIALFTHMHIFWVIGLLLALVDIPDLGGWLGRITTSVEKMAGIDSTEKVVETPAKAVDRKLEERATLVPQDDIPNIRFNERSARSDRSTAGTRT
jgi:hypothetical protein